MSHHHTIALTGTPQANPQGYHDGSPIHYAKHMKDDQNLIVIHGNLPT
jgi:hypothetical protein